MPTDLDTAKYVSFTTFKKDGTAVPTPVWVVPFEGGYAFTTDTDAGKVKRIRNNPTVTVAVSDMRGRVVAGAVVHHGRAEAVDEATALRVTEAIRKKYRIAYVLVISPGNLWNKVRGKSKPAGGVRFTLDD
jgi:PPOX class probable F420-dependent enzyme